VKVRVSYHGIEVETEIPDRGSEKHEKNALGYNTNKYDYAFKYSEETADDVAVRLIRESVESIQVLVREGAA
jgi:hypothetical protein